MYNDRQHETSHHRPAERCQALRRGIASVALLALLQTITGCGRPAGVIFEPPDTPITWPQHEVGARVRYVGQLQTSADLKPARGAFQRLGDLLAGTKAPSPLYGPRSVVSTHDATRVWIADPGGRCLHVFDLESRAYTKIETLGSHRLATPSGLCIGPEGRLLLCDSEGLMLLEIDIEGGALQRLIPLSEFCLRPVAVAYDPATDERYVADVADHNIKVFAPDGEVKRTLGQRGDTPGRFNYPCDVAFDGEVLWVTDSGNHRVQGLRPDGRVAVIFGKAGDAPGHMALPKNVAIDPDGHVYVVDARFENIQIFNREGRLLLVVGEEGNGPGQFWLPAGVFIDKTRKMWVCDPYNRRVQVFELLDPPSDTELSEGDAARLRDREGEAGVSEETQDAHP